MKYKSLYIIFSCIFALNGYSQTGREVMEKNIIQLTTQSAEYESYMTLLNKRGQKRVREVKRFEITDDNGNKSYLVQFTYPADVEGTSLLTIEYSDRDDDSWLFLPALNQSRRIPSTDISKSFMSTDFTYEDLKKDDIDEFEYKLIGKDTINGIKCNIIEATPKTEKKKKETGYSKRILYVSEQHYLVVCVKYYNKKGAFFKEYIGEDIRQIENTNKWRIFKMTMYNLEREHKTILETKNYLINKGIKEDIFTKRYVESFSK